MAPSLGGVIFRACTDTFARRCLCFDQGGAGGPEEASIAREVAVQQGSTSITQATSTATERLATLHPVVPVAQDAAPSTPAEDAQPGTRALLVGPDQRALELSYQLDRASNTWVARILDADSGEVVRQVPSTRVLHQLAELSHATRIDRRA
jgi:FlaG protein